MYMYSQQIWETTVAILWLVTVEKTSRSLLIAG